MICSDPSLARPPAEQEQTELEQMIRARTSRREAIEHLMWALINTPEFVFND